MVLWILPRLTDQRTDTSTFTPVSHAIQCYVEQQLILTLASLLCISTVDASRVVVSVPDIEGSDYINASYIDVRIHVMIKCQLLNVT